MSLLLKGSEVAKEILARSAADALTLKENGVTPTLLLIRVGSNEADLFYEASLRRAAEKSGVEIQTKEFPDDVSASELTDAIRTGNKDQKIHGILVFRPLQDLPEQQILNEILPKKDVDGSSEVSLTGIFLGKEDCFSPCTAEAVLRILSYYGMKIEGRRVVVFGRSTVVGRPLSMLLLKENATVTVCHTKTKGPEAIAKEADILISACGTKGVIGPDHVHPGQWVIDVGICENEDGTLSGDVAFDKVAPHVFAITPVPGGVGAVTSAVLMEHVVASAKEGREG